MLIKTTNKCPDQPTCPELGQRNPRGFAAHFDIAVPGGGVGGQNHCNEQYPGYFKQPWCDTAADPMCPCNDVPDHLKESCRTFMALNLDNPAVEFREVPCPAGVYPAAKCVDGDFNGWPGRCPGRL